MMWPSFPQLKQRLLRGSFFTRLVWSRSIGWGAGDAVVAEGLEKEEVVVVEVTTGGEQNKDGLVVAAFGCLGTTSTGCQAGRSCASTLPKWLG